MLCFFDYAQMISTIQTSDPFSGDHYVKKFDLQATFP
jgi:hypothetical protein